MSFGGSPRSAAALLAAALATSSACSPSPPDRGPNLVMITIDTLRADHVGAYGYFRDTTPNLDRLAADSLVCERAVAPMATTLPSHVSMLTGTYPARHAVVSNFRFIHRSWQPTQGLLSIAQMLQTAGYETAAFTSSSPLSAETGIAAGFDTFVGPPVISMERGRIDVPAARTVNAALDWLGEAGEPFFLWVHLFDPHDPYLPPPPYDLAFTAGPELEALLRRRGFPDPKAAATTVDLYDGEILYADEQVGRLLSGLQRRGVDGQTVLVVAGDHGEGLGQHGQPRHGGVWSEQLLVPLLIRVPGRPAGRLTGPASLIDIAPTLSGGGGLPLDAAQFDGVDLTREPPRFALAQREVRKDRPGRRLVLTEARWTYWHGGGEEDRLFDLERDPHELENVVDRHRARARSMLSAMEELLADSAARPGPPLGAEVPESLRRQLEALGYVE